MNKVMLIGNVGQDPDVRYFEQDQAVAQVRNDRARLYTSKRHTGTRPYRLA